MSIMKQLHNGTIDVTDETIICIDGRYFNPKQLVGKADMYDIDYFNQDEESYQEGEDILNIEEE